MVVISADEEKLLRNILQYEDSKRYYDWACLILGESKISKEELFIWYWKMGFAHMFAIAWEAGKDPLNLYYTGLEIGHEPDWVDGYRHFVRYQEEGLVHA